MHHFARGSARSSAAGIVDVARFEQFETGDPWPFGAMWYTVPPGESPPADQHPEREMSIVLSGVASVEASGEITDVAAGSAFLLDSGEAHVIHNRSEGEPLVVFSAYWMPTSHEDGQ